jgi:hypothetical protein
VLLNNIFRDAFHPKNLYVEASAIRQGVVNCREVLFVYLTHVDTQA